jgi:ABC-type glycerol-3-phosphate transport system substrate-binding protein
VALSLFLFLAGCAHFPDSKRADPPPQQIELRLWHAWRMERREILDSIIEEFNLRGGAVRVVAAPLGPSGGSVAERIMLAQFGGKPADLALIEREAIPPLADAGLIRPLDDFLKRTGGPDSAGSCADALTEENLLPVASAYTTYAGEVYGIPAFLNPIMLICNPEALSTVGAISGPARDWASLEATAEALDQAATPGSRRWALGVRSMVPVFDVLCLQREVDIYRAASDPVQATALGEILDFIHALRRRPSMLPPRYKFWNPLFAGVTGGKALYQIDTATMLAHLMKDAPGPLEAEAVPSDSGPPRTGLSRSAVFVVPSSEARDEAVREFLEFLYSPERHSRFAEKMLVVSPLKDASHSFEESFPQIVEAAQKAVVFPLKRNSGRVTPKIARAVEKLDAGLIDPGRALEEILGAVKRADEGVSQSSLSLLGERRKAKQEERSGSESLPSMNAAPPPGPSALVSVLWAESTRRIFADTYSGLRSAPISIAAAGNEHEAFQLVLSASSALDGLTLDFAPFVSESGESRAIEMTASLVTDTLITKPLVAHEAGPYPNALEPREEFDILPGRLTRIWINAFIADDVTPGRYSSWIRVMSGNTIAARAKIELRALPLTIPSAPSQPAVIGLNYDLIARRYGLTDDAEARREVMDSFYRFVLERRLTPLQPPVATDSPELASYLADERVSAYRLALNPSDERFQNAAALAKRNGLLEKMFAYFVDEPTYHRYAAIIDAGKQIDAMPASPRFLVTCFPDEPLIGYVDIWCVHLGFLPVGIPRGYMERLDFADAVARRLDAGDEVWWYTAGAIGPFPTLHIEDDPAAFRVIPWLQRLYRIGGFLHWEAANWSVSSDGDPYVTFFGNGEGALVYPGDLRPVSSIRLELLRAGFEDMEHLLLLGRKIEELQLQLGAERLGEAASKRVGEMCRRLIREDALRASATRDLLLLPHFSREAGLIERVREEVAEETILLGKRPRALVLTEPEEKRYTESEEVRIYGAVEPGCRLEINGRTVKVDGSGNFSAVFPLSNGTNAFEVLLRKEKDSKIIRRKIEKF